MKKRIRKKRKRNYQPRRVICSDSELSDNEDGSRAIRANSFKIRKLLSSEENTRFMGTNDEKQKNVAIRQLLLDTMFDNIGRQELDLKRETLPFVKAGQWHPNILKTFQCYALNWIISKFNNAFEGCILGDEMGLGKTIVGICLMNWHFKHHEFSDLYEFGGKRVPKPQYLVICPGSVMGQWGDEIRKWSPNLLVEKFHGQEKVTFSVFQRGWDVLLTNYGTIRTLPSKAPELWRAFQNKVFSIVIFDEGHKVKNRGTHQRKTCERLKTGFRLLMTGTPYQIHVGEVWSLLALVLPEWRIGKESAFVARFENEERMTDFSVTKLGRAKTTKRKSVKNSRVFQEQVLDEFVLCRKKQRVMAVRVLAPKFEIVLQLELREGQKILYRAFLEREKKKMHKSKLGDVGLGTKYELVQRLKDICDHPFMIKNGEKFVHKQYLKKTRGDGNGGGHQNEEDYDDFTPGSPEKVPDEEEERNRLREMVVNPFNLDQEVRDKLLISSSVKFVVLEKLLRKVIHEKGEKVLIFCNRVDMIDILEDFCDVLGYGYCMIRGDVSFQEREKQVREFNRSSEKMVFLLSTKAANLGLNLMSASTVILYNLNYNPFVDTQAAGRSHRIGQMKQVKVFKFTTKNTIEKVLLETGGFRLLNEERLMGTGSNSNQNLLKKKASIGNQETILKKCMYEMYNKMNLDSTKSLDNVEIDDIIKESSVVNFNKNEDETNRVDLEANDFWDRYFPNHVDINRLTTQFNSKKGNFQREEISDMINDLLTLYTTFKEKEEGEDLNVTDVDIALERGKLLALVLAMGNSGLFKKRMSQEDYFRLKTVHRQLEERKSRRAKTRRNFSYDSDFRLDLSGSDIDGRMSGDEQTLQRLRKYPGSESDIDAMGYSSDVTERAMSSGEEEDLDDYRLRKFRSRHGGYAGLDADDDEYIPSASQLEEEDDDEDEEEFRRAWQDEKLMITEDGVKRKKNLLAPLDDSESHILPNTFLTSSSQDDHEQDVAPVFSTPTRFQSSPKKSVESETPEPVLLGEDEIQKDGFGLGHGLGIEDGEDDDEIEGIEEPIKRIEDPIESIEESIIFGEFDNVDDKSLLKYLDDK